ncbi:DUF4139 domain-containing protein [Amycolatopsis sp. FDAARGOS 1241]|uniref:DUF4139 domain-containing protein n=1 Tax=Amycolatopsis sp. FDAARGOS 1241 TaxID=2778070 RepID=UPI00194E4177|nr:DUF4139 domain-containing protein [Amycolatopsis sp. FDAARGOS 1241]QRP44080.1 DUF4139 domain-containing protein [Amycolatopsis sp. FDAARGOS 1241]
MDAPIVAVTVYPQHARITRRGRANLAEGTRVRITGLPLALDAESVRVTGTGAALITGVDVGYEQHAQPADPVLSAFADQRRADQAALDAVADQEAAEAAKVELLTGLAKRSGASFAKALASGVAGPARVEEVTGALGTQLAAALRTRRALTERLERMREDLAALDRRVASHSAQSEQDSSTVTVELEPQEDSGSVELELSYVVPGASWEPGYDVRVRETEVTITSYGLVSQHTGEDWPECELVLSTARPASTVVVPELDPWFLDRRQPAQPARPLAAFAAAAPGAAPAGAASLRRVAPKFAEVEQGATALTYRPGRAVAIPSGAQGHRTTLARLELTAELGYVTAPVRASEAYLRATVVNTSEHTLRAGRAAVFHDTEFVGTTRFDVWAPGEEVELALGVDDRIRVERELVRRTASKATLSGQRRREAEYRTRLTNHSPREAVVTVLDQAPVSRDEAITVRDVRATPDPVETDDLGSITWRLTLAAGATATATLAYRVDVAKGVELSGWRE